MHKFMHQQMLPAGEEHSCDVGKRQENVPKNRFRTTFPCKKLTTEITAINNLTYTFESKHSSQKTIVWIS